MRGRERAAWPPTQTQAAARGIKLQAWLVCHIEVPMCTTNSVTTVTELMQIR